MHASRKMCNITLIYGGSTKLSMSYRKSGSRNMMVTQLWGRYHVPQNVFLVKINLCIFKCQIVYLNKLLHVAKNCLN